jgi:FtsH-binding integral membrane protein
MTTETTGADVMTEANRPRLRALRTVAWIGSAVAFVGAEVLVILSEWYRHLYRIETFHFWFVPIMCVVPLMVGFNFDRSIRRESKCRGSGEAGIDTSAMIGILIFTAYVAIATTAVNFL